MPLILNIETSTQVCSVALAEDGKILALKEQGGAYTHAENLTLFIESVFAESSRIPEQLSAVAISIGPGSYTGLRIGVSTAKGLCYALQKPLIAIQTLEALAHVSIDKTLAEEALLCPMLDARRMEVYCALYTLKGELVEPVQAKIIDANSFSEYLQKSKIIFLGDGTDKCKSIITHPHAIFRGDLLPSAKFMVSLAEEAFTNKQFADVAYAEPFYLKEFQTGIKGNPKS